MKNQFNTPEWQRRFRNLTTDIKQQKTVLLLGTEIIKMNPFSKIYKKRKT